MNVRPSVGCPLGKLTGNLDHAILNGCVDPIHDNSAGSRGTLLTLEAESSCYNRFSSRYGRKLRRRTRVIDSVDGFVVWLDPASPEADTPDLG